MIGRDVSPLRRTRHLARAALAAERLAVALAPAFAVFAAFGIAALVGLLAALPAIAASAALAASLLGAGTLAVRALRRLEWPTEAEADRAIERRNGLTHAPLSVLADTPSIGDTALWSAHRARAHAVTRRLRLVRPDPRLAATDRFALRAALAVGLVAAIVIAGPDATTRLAGALTPRLPFPVTSALASQIQGWIVPPDYTALPPVALDPAGGPVAAPMGARLTLDVLGDRPSLVAPEARDFASLDPNTWQVEQPLHRSGTVAVTRGRATLASWQVTVAPDAPPRAAWTAPPRAQGRQTRLPWTASDDYGVASLRAEIALAGHDDPPSVIPIPLQGGRTTDVHGTYPVDLTTHVWAGLPVHIRLVARDAVDQEGASATADITLPERDFRNPAARALMAARKMLALHPEDRRGPVDEIERMLNEQPEAFGEDAGAWLALGALAGTLRFDQGPTTVPDAQAELLALALRLEQDSDSPTDRALDRARDAARDALDDAARTQDQPHRDALDAKLDTLEQALAARLRELQHQSRETGRPADWARRRVITDQQLHDTAEAARQAAREGRMDEAREKLAELERLLDALRDAKPLEHTDRPAEEHGAASALRALARRQGALMDRAQARAAQPGQQGAARQSSPDAARARDRGDQDSLRRDLESLARSLAATPGQPEGMGQQQGQQDTAGLAEADQAMRDAATALAPDGTDQAAQAAQRRAAAGLRRAYQAMRDAQGQGTDLDQDPDQQGQSSRTDDPDATGGAGPDLGEQVKIPANADQLRARDLRDELRRRGAERSRPAEELDYIDRLLKAF